MSLIVQVGGGGGGPPPPQKGVVITATSHVAPAGASQRPPQPPPAHVTQPFSSPSYVEPVQHVVQHHPQPQPQAQVLSPGLAQRPLSHSPSRHHRHRHGEAISGSRIVVNHHGHHHGQHHQLPTQPLPHLPSSPLPLMSPSPAGHLLHTSVNSPSLIPQNIPSGLMPRLPLQLPGRHQLTPRSAGHDTNILPPHVFRKLNRQTPQQPDDDIEMTDNHHHPPRRSLMSPKHNRRNFFNNVALQDHNYCAAPPPSPPRSPTPPRSPYTNNISHAGMVAAKHETVVEDRMTSYIGPASPHYRLKQSIDDAGVGPLTPGDNESFRDRSASDNMEDGGEETETAPEADDEGQDDSVTRCVCDFLHDDGYMIQCDKCSVWQHVVCMGLDKNNIPDEYLCEKCNPRTVDRKRAKALQKAREKEIFAKIRLVNDSSDDDKTRAGLASLEKNRKHFSSLSRKFNGGKKALEKKLLENKKLLKKTHKKRLLKEPGRGQDAAPTSPTKKSSSSPRKNIRRKSLSATDAETEPEENPGETLSLRSWIDNYEEAVTNHYSPELRARLTGAKISTNFSKAKDVNGIRCNVSLRGNGLKVLTANSFIPSDTPVIECRGKYMLNNPGLIKASKNNPYVLQHKLNNELEVLVDGTTYGNDSRFCRRASPSSGESNAVIRHHLEKGSLHLYIVASRNIEKNQEILLPSLEKKNGVIEEEMSIADELREIKKASGKLMNGNVEGRRKLLNKKRVAKRDVGKKKEEPSSSDEEDDERKTEREARIAKEKERLARQREEREKEKERERGEDKTSPRKTRSAAVSDVKEEVVEVKEEVKEVIKKEEPEDTKQLTIMIPKEKEEDSMENSPTASDPSPSAGSVKSPVKPSLGLPDQSGLIVGVNTINYDVSFRNKTKTREERKMEMIMKAIEAMEKNEARKRNESDEKGGKPEKKRRRSNSTKTGQSGAVESQDQSSADEGYGGARRPAGLSRGRGRKQSASLSGQRRRSRAKSGDSSAMSETETADEIVGDFKYPGAVCEDQDDDVSRQYIRGSRSPPGIANHLLRSAKTDRAKELPKKPAEAPVEVAEVRPAQLSEPKTIGCSAKKRWLRAAMSVDMSEGERPFEEGGSGASPAQASPEPDYTPLKKRRLATYSNDASEDVAAVVEGLNSPQVSEKIKSLPNGVKKRLMSNLVLEAVLDKAMEDFKMPPGYNEDNALDSNNEDTSSPMINDEEMDESESSGKPRSFKDKRKEAIYKAELDRKSANSSESEEATADARDVQYKEAPVPGLVNNDPAHDNNDKVPENENKLEDDVPSEEKEFCMTPVQDEPLENGADDGKTDPAAPVPSQNSQFKSFFSTDLSVEDIDRQLAAKREALVKEAAEEAETLLSSTTSPGSEESRPGSAGTEAGGSSGTPQVKKVVSLADYKRRKQQVGDSSTPASTPTTPTPGLAASLPPLSLASLPSLPGLDSFSQRREAEILSDKARSRNSSSHRTSSRPNSASNSRSPSRAPGGHKTPSSSPLPAYQEQPREDLTERLRKEFGLNIDESDEADTDGGEVMEREEKVVKEHRERKVAREDSRLDSRRDGREGRQSEQSRVHRRDSHSEKNYKYDKRDYRDSRDSYKSHHRDSRYHDKRPPSHHSGSRRPPHPSSPTNGPARGLHNGGSRRSGSHHSSPTRRNSQESESRYSHSSHPYYKNESSRRNLSRNFYTQ